MNAILAKYLKDFSVPEPPVSASNLDEMMGASLDFPMFDDSQPVEPAIDVDALVEQARHEGYEAAREEFEARHETEIATLMSVHAGEMDDLRSAFEQQLVSLVEQRFADLRDDLVSRLSVRMGQLMAPVLEDTIRARTIEDLANAVREAMEGNPTVMVTLRGPAELCEPLKARLDDMSIASQVIETAAIDVSVEMGESVIVSRLSAWRDGLAEVLA